MKNKMLARRIAIAMLSAGMVMTTVPVSTFAADVVSVEASDANAYGGQSVTDDAFKTALTTAVTGLSGYTLTSKSSASDLSAIANSINSVSAMSTGSYSITNLKITGATAPTYQTTAKGGALVMPVVTITADVYKGSTTAWGTCTFTLDASALTKKEQITAAEAIVEGAGGKSDVDPNADKYANEDNSSKLADYVGELLATSNTKIVVAGTSAAAGTKLENIKVGTTTDGTNKTAAVSQSAITPATKAAAGSEAVAVTFDIKLTKAVDSTDPDWDNTAADQNADQHLTGSASYTATIKKLGVTSDDADYQAKVEQALSAVTFTNQNFVGAIKSGNKGAAFTSTDTTITSNGGITADATVTKALASVGVYEADNAGSNLAITYRNFTAASHKADGSVTILLDQKRDQADGTTKHAYATVTVPVTHADDTVAIGDEISAKIVALVKAYVADSKDITPTTLDATAQKKEITAKLQAAVEKALSDKLDGTNTIASEIDKVEVEITDFEASTATGNGKIKKANVIVTFKDDAPARTALTNPGAGFDAQPVSGKKKQLTFSYDSTSYGSEITLYKVTAVSATSLTLPEETPYNTLTKTNEVKVTPTFTPSDSNNYVIRWSLDDNSKFKFTTDAYATYDKAKTSADDGKISDASAAKIAFLANDGITIDTTSANAGDTATLTAELIDSDGLVAAKATTTLKAVKGFSDVQNTHDYAYNAIKYLSTSRTVNKNDKYTKVAVIEGVGNNLFNSNGDVTRAQFVTFLYRLAQWESDEYTSEEAYSTYTDKDNNTPKTISIDGTDTNVSAAGGEAITYYSDGAGKTYSFPKFTDSKASNKFTDVDANAYYAKAVDWAVANGIANGKTDTTFDPNGKVTRAEAATFLYRYYANGQSYNAADFTDVPTTAYYANAVGWASSNGVTQGKTATTFAPNDTTTRKETAAFIYRATNTAKINK
jgi:hypothetical protein